ncbi:esterase/lipase family protein [Clostridium formicaceticum]|uniref:Lecithin:cholesterol acyltransferase n=1 Tax=Clostridium formicaceticum TaxID=1497 RepID=A0AAC9RK23_9CLOT|nr:alpha/beta hydrolase [Clostridium formicaceticum]AOY76342.1 hypothetical protein BJL90_10760 [Clostridium formicaceticum]ARE86733.1 Lecithin:cholesterol acyltransferase [Clostridium formicaceticum]
MQDSSNNPIIFIPGLMGCMGNDIIAGTGDWSFGVARWVYDPFIKQLEELNYHINENLFVCYYDWRQKNTKTVEVYLKPLLKQVKEKHPNKKIDFICHSMGGIVARTYIQNRSFQYDVDKLIMIATPNRGAIEAYYLWSTGNLIPNKKKSHFYNFLTKGYIWMILRLMNVSLGLENLETIHRTFPAIEELIPSLDYGEILCYEEGNGEWKTVPRYYMKYRNDLLDQLNADLYLLSHRVRKTYWIAGYNYSTAEYLMIDRKKLREYEESILDVVETLDGDGTVAVKSVELEEYEHCYLEASHRNIVASAYPYINKIYTNQSIDLPRRVRTVKETTLHILFTGKLNVIVKKEEKMIMCLQEGNVSTPYVHIYEKYPENYQWIILKDVPKGMYQIQVDNYEAKDMHIMVMGEGLKEIENEKEIKAHQRDYQFNFQID